ncbi:MAG: hypothetical protein KF729_36990, partial [Sandaracinaceae bacterium]|nr:hypothetical protein [Sandaracinaceae bacterium]
MERKIEMHWVCSACGQRNLGRHEKCQRCGDPKDASERWIMPDDTASAPTITDPALLAQASAGPDWQCGYCGSHQKRLDGACARCGAAQADGARVPAGGASTGGPSAPRGVSLAGLAGALGGSRAPPRRPPGAGAQRPRPSRQRPSLTRHRPVRTECSSSPCSAQPGAPAA